MKFLIINADYPAFLQWFYDGNPGLTDSPYNEQIRARNATLFGVADFYSGSLIRQGHEAWDVHFNNDFIQHAWAREHGMNVTIGKTLSRTKRFAARTPLRHLRAVLRPLVPKSDPYNMLAEQIRHYRPDIILNQVVDWIPDDFLVEIKPNVRLVIGQIAAPLPKEKTFRSYDLMLSSLPNFVHYFRKQGIRSELHRLAFETSIPQQLQDRPPKTDVSFVGTISSFHATRVGLMEAVCSKVDVAWWGNGDSSLPKSSLIGKHHRGTAWGREMYQILKDSRITLNNHIDIAEGYANNMRLFEATGVGTMLITDKKRNLHEIFEPGKEVAVYDSPEECIEVIAHYLGHDAERASVARAGQQRTLRDHNYDVRTQELLELLRKGALV